MVLPASVAPSVFVLLWSTGFIGARYAMPWAEPFSFLAVRFAIAFVLIAGLARLARAQRTTLAGVLHSAIAGMLMHGIYLGGVFFAVDRGMTAGMAGLIVGLQPLMTAVMAGAVLGEPVSSRQWTGLAAGLAGVVVVVWPKLGAVSGLGGLALSAATIAVVGMSAGTIWQKRFCAGIDLLTGAKWQYLGGTAVTAVAAAAFETWRFTLSGELVFAMAWLVLVLSIGAIVLLMAMIRSGALSKVASLFYLVPATTALIAYFLFGETLTLLQLGGMVLAAFGVALASSGPRSAPAVS